MAKRSKSFAAGFIDLQEEKVRRIIGRAARKGADATRHNIMFESATGTAWHRRINKMRKQPIGARRETGKMLESVRFSRPVKNTTTGLWEASFGFPYAENTFGNIANTRSSKKYTSRLDSMRNPKFRPWGSDKNYIAMQEYGSDMPGSNVKVGMHATGKAMVVVQKYIVDEMSKLYKKVK